MAEHKLGPIWANPQSGLWERWCSCGTRHGNTSYLALLLLRCGPPATEEGQSDG